MIAGGGGRAGFAVEGFGEDPRRRSLADPARAGEEKGMVHPPRLDGVGQGAADMLLADQVSESLGAPFAGQYQIRHALQATPGKDERTPAIQKALPAQVTARRPRGTRIVPLPLLPSGPDGVHGHPLRGTRLSLLSAINQTQKG